MKDTQATVESTATNFSNPFRGAESYQESDRKKFYGREKEINELMGIIDQYTLAMLYSKSGVGKTSLINAGLIPILKELKSFFPVYIRLSDEMINDKNIRDFSDVVVEEIKKSAKQNSVTIISDDLIAFHPSVTEFIYFSSFRNAVDKSGKVRESVPVLIFDQFEEIFSREFKKASPAKLLADLYNIIESQIPASLSEKCPVTPGDERILILKEKLQMNTKWYRVLFSFREEYLHRFDALKEIIPTIFYTNGRLHLETFSVDAASKVIQEISADSITLEPELARNIAVLINRLGMKKSEFKEEVQPFLLSLVCKSLYPGLKGPKANPAMIERVMRLDDSVVRDIIDKYVNSVYGVISERTRKFIGEKLITDKGNRTSYSLDNIINQSVKAELERLCTEQNYRLLNKVEYFESTHVEILHDRLLNPLIAIRDKMRNKRMASRLAIVLGSTITGIVCLLLVYINETKKRKQYDSFFKSQNARMLETMNKDIQDNSMLAFLNIVEYSKTLDSLPFYRPSFWGYSSSREGFKDSIVKKFDNQFLAVRLLDTFINAYSYDYYTDSKIFKYKIDTTASSYKIRFFKIAFKGYVYFDSIDLPNKQASTPDKSALSSGYPRNDYIRIYFSNDDSLAMINYFGGVALYNLYSNGEKRIKKMWSRAVEDYYTYYRFSEDSKLLISERVMPSKGSKYTNHSVYYAIAKGSDSVTEILQRTLAVDYEEEYFRYYFFNKKRQIVEAVNHFGRNWTVRNSGDNFRNEITIRARFCRQLSSSIVAFMDRSNVKLLNLASGDLDSIQPQRVDTLYSAGYLPDKGQLIVIEPSGDFEIINLANKEVVDKRPVGTLPSANGKSLIYKNHFISPDESRILFDYGEKLEIIDLAGGKVEAGRFISKSSKGRISVIFNKEGTILFNDGASITTIYSHISPGATFDTLNNKYEEFKRLRPDITLSKNDNYVRSKADTYVSSTPVPVAK